jgi:hypothetical protein
VRRFPGHVGAAALAGAPLFFFLFSENALAHGEEAALFVNLAGEHGFLRVAVALFGGTLTLLGAGVFYQGWVTRKRTETSPPKRRKAALELLVPGAAIAGLGLAIAAGGLFLVPEVVNLPHPHRTEEAGAPARPEDLRLKKSLGKRGLSNPLKGSGGGARE